MNTLERTMSTKRCVLLILTLSILLAATGCAASGHPLRSEVTVRYAGHHGGTAVHAGGGGHLNYNDDSVDCCIDALQGFVLFAILVDIFSR